ncbi:MAG: Rod shape-determining protein RodA [Candidatus Dependentiae bacterium ADurb.Bin331]|nr:MAG: Rod shape-determining protein RodA [Candidatus Dependentiae bacterium ADurb.Bin331]
MIFASVRRVARYFDWVSFGITLILISIGLLFIYSATTRPEQVYSIFFKKQLFGAGSALCIYFFFCICDYRTLMRWGYFLYIAIIGFLIFTLIKGSIGKGGQRWVDLIFFKFQPSEVSKLFLPAFITHHLYAQNDSPRFIMRDFVPILLILIASFVLIQKQPDLGTALLVAFTGTILLWAAGLDKKWFVLGCLFITCTAPILWKFLKPYQKQRIAVFLGEGNMHKERYQIEQSKIAIGSGGLCGKGFLKGTQNKLMFLPESRTDFIFSVICEEWGFCGALFIMMLYIILFLRLLYLISTIKIFFAQLLALGLMLHCLLACIINVAMVTGLLPIVGIPLPLISYGISNLWITLASLGWINGITIRRYYIGD